jgi:hypothetical protein
MSQLPTWLEYGSACAAIFSSVFVGVAGLYFTYRQWRFAKDQPKRDLEAHRRSLKAAKYERLIADFAVILRHSMAQKEYIHLQNVVIPGKDPQEQAKQLMDYLYAESDGLTLTMMKVQLKGVGEEILKIGYEQSAVQLH